MFLWRNIGAPLLTVLPAMTYSLKEKADEGKLQVGGNWCYIAFHEAMAALVRREAIGMLKLGVDGSTGSVPGYVDGWQEGTPAGQSM